MFEKLPWVLTNWCNGVPIVYFYPCHQQSWRDTFLGTAGSLTCYSNNDVSVICNAIVHIDRARRDCLQFCENSVDVDGFVDDDNILVENKFANTALH